MKKTVCLFVIILALALIPFGRSFHAAGETETAERLTAAVVMPEGREAEAILLTDDCAATHVIFRNGSTVRFDFSGEAKNLVTVWKTEPGSVKLICYQGETMLSDSDLVVPFLSTVTELPEGTTAVELILNDPQKGKVCLSDVYAYTAGTLPATEYQWQRAEHPDVLLVVAFPGDEYRFFGGLLPKLISDGANVAVLYCADMSRARLEEGFRALWSLGLKTYPVRIGIDSDLAVPEIKTYYSLDYGKFLRAWTSTGIEHELEERITALRPTVVIVPSDSEDSAVEARAVSKFVQEAVSKHPESFQKLYAAGPGDETLTVVDEPLLAYDGQSGDTRAQQALDSMHSVDYWEYRVRTEGTYHLVQTQVGSDGQDGSFFTNVSVELHPPVTPTPTPTEPPTDTPEPTPTQEPTAVPTDTQEPTSTPMQQKRGWLSCAGKEITPAPTSAPTPEPTEKPTPAPTEEPTPAPTEEPTPAPTEEPTPAAVSGGFADHFLAEGEAEQFTMDAKNGHWTFRDQSTDIDVRCEKFSTADEAGRDQPQRVFIAHIRMRKNQVRSGFGNESRDGATPGKLYGMARRNGAVLAVTGDNLFNYDEAWTLKSTSIRDGHVYYDRSGAAVMAWNDRTLSFDLFEKNTFTGNDLIERGYRDVLSFGPILMKDGEVIPGLNSYPGASADYDRPRVGVGQIEPGHFVVVVADGNNPGIANGFKLGDFAAFFRNEGCITAYNLDGGMSADIVFMGVHLRTRKNVRNLPDCLLFGHTELLPRESDPRPDFYKVGVDENGNTVFVPKG